MSNPVNLGEWPFSNSRYCKQYEASMTLNNNKTRELSLLYYLPIAEEKIQLTPFLRASTWREMQKALSEIWTQHTNSIFCANNHHTTHTSVINIQGNNSLTDPINITLTLKLHCIPSLTNIFSGSTNTVLSHIEDIFFWKGSYPICRGYSWHILSANDRIELTSGMAGNFWLEWDGEVSTYLIDGLYLHWVLTVSASIQRYWTKRQW